MTGAVKKRRWMSTKKLDCNTWLRVGYRTNCLHAWSDVCHGLTHRIRDFLWNERTQENKHFLGLAGSKRAARASSHKKRRSAPCFHTSKRHSEYISMQAANSPHACYERRNRLTSDVESSYQLRSLLFPELVQG
jgi:hypothetical protein